MKFARVTACRLNEAFMKSSTHLDNAAQHAPFRYSERPLSRREEVALEGS